MKIFLHRYFEDHTVVSQKVICSDLCLFAIAISAFFILSGCAAMLLPNSGMPLVDKTKPVQFIGGVPSPKVDITIQAYDPAGKSWDVIGTITSGSQPWGPDSTYLWGGGIVIPAKYWAEGQKCATTGESALVRSKWAQGYLPSVRAGYDANPVTCWEAHHPASEFFSYCLSPETPNVRVESLDYFPFGWTCTDVINAIRQLEGKPWLKEDEAGECHADADASCNFTNGPHFCNTPPQDDCGAAYPTIVEGILGTCIWQQMYLTEKANYNTNLKNNPTDTMGTGCYSSPYPKGCGHYVNMVIDSRPTKVACGIYKTPGGKFYSVQNFGW